MPRSVRAPTFPGGRAAGALLSSFQGFVRRKEPHSRAYPELVERLSTNGKTLVVRALTSSLHDLGHYGFNLPAAIKAARICTRRGSFTWSK
jgi:hypothetical protein